MEEFYYNYHSCCRLEDFNAIEAAITNIMEQEKGCQRLLKLPELSFDPKQIRDLNIEKCPRLLVVGLFGGEEGWTIIKTYPAEFLCMRNTNSDRPRLSELAIQLRCDAFHYRVVRSSIGILMEADPYGRLFVSGSKDFEGNYIDDEEYRFYQEKINQPGSCSEFFLVEVSESIKAAMLINDDPELELRKAEYRKHIIDSDPVDPDAHFQALIALEEVVLKGYAERIDCALSKVIDPSLSFWKETRFRYSMYGDLLYSAYVEAEDLEQKGVKLFYFQPPDNYDFSIRLYQ
jgi:hypothetical protein